MADWFSKLSPSAQKAYIKKHPLSKYAKAYRKKNRPRVSGIAAIKQASKKLAAIAPPPKPRLDPVKVAKLHSKVSALKDSIDSMNKVFKAMQSK